MRPIINQKVINDIIRLLLMLRVQYQDELKILCGSEISAYMDREYVERTGDFKLEAILWEHIKTVQARRARLEWLIEQTKIICYIASA